MQKKMYTMLIAALTMGVILTGCGNGKETNDDVNGTEISQTSEPVETQVIEVVEDATMTEGENGSITVETDTGEQVVIDDSTKVTENEDGSKTYETTDGKKVNVDANGKTTVTTEEKVTVDTQTPPTGNTEKAHTHSYSASVTKEATCTSTGVKTFQCSCGSSYTKDMDAKGHTSSDWVTTKEANCTTEGSKQKSCTVCGTALETEKIAKTSTHTTGDWIVTKEASCNTAGSKHKVCSVCGVETETATISATGTHNYSWSTNGDTRTMKCACGATGITEYKYGNAWGYFDDAEAESLWYWINESRKSAETIIRDPTGKIIGKTNVAALNKNDSLTSKARNRAVEAAVNFDHGGNEHECLAWGYGSGVEAYEAWCYSSAHAQAMINPDYTIGGVAFFWYDSDGSGKNLTPIAVLELD